MEIELMLPDEIEAKSMEIIEKELDAVASHFSSSEMLIVKRVIHTTADFDYADNLKFSTDAVASGISALKNGAVIVTDTQMAKSGISKPAAAFFGCDLYCFMSDADVAVSAKENKTTRAIASMEKAAELLKGKPVIFAVGNAPTALIRLFELIEQKRVSPALIIAAPVGFVNVVQSKELIMSAGVPYIAAAGRKGGSNVAAAVCNAMLYQIYDRGLKK